MTLYEIIREMTDEQFRQYQKYAVRYCETHDCDKCRRYLTKFEERVLNK